MGILLFVICLAASSIGAVVGAGGGVIIKPVVDLLGLLPVSTVSFCSGCTVLCMSISSLIRTRNNGVKLEVKISTMLAVGAAIGGLIGKWLFELVRNSFGNENTLGAIQSTLLAVLIFVVFIYICNKDKLPSLRIQNMALTALIGLCLGLASSFLGIGGGTSNVAVLFLFFSMDAKTAAKNSIYIIIFSQITSISTALITHSVPAFTWPVLLCMIAGGVGGAILGAAITKRIDNKGVEKLLKLLILFVIAVSIYNILKFTVLS
ncbi:MAG: sulfite exporter TauE/SafE family protein [Lachnospiraceae bacterium]|nr:sulfite exporter TauE/SafE family protein [Lachnospiraceae bacterium]